MLKLGVVGYGRRSRHMVRELEAFGTVRLHAVADPRMDELQAEFADQNRSVALYENVDAMLESTELDGVLIGTRCNTHAKITARVAQAGVPIFLEKPVGISYDDLALLLEVERRYQPAIVVSFPLRFSPLLRRVKEIIDSGLIGTVENVQAVNNVPYGETYYTNWYRDASLTGGLFLQKATHDLDYIFYLLQQRPAVICAMSSRRVYGGDKPFDLHCADCDEQKTCMESPFNAYVERLTRNSPIDEKRLCLFSAGIENQDNGSIIVQLENGVQAAYVQNFYARNGAAKRGARLLGYKGTVEFDWQEGIIDIHMHHSQRSERITFRKLAGLKHYGGDRAMARNFIEVMSGQGRSEATLQDGIISALACLHARDSAKNLEFRRVVMPQTSDKSMVGSEVR